MENQEIFIGRGEINAGLSAICARTSHTTGRAGNAGTGRAARYRAARSITAIAAAHSLAGARLRPGDRRICYTKDRKSPTTIAADHADTGLRPGDRRICYTRTGKTGKAGSATTHTGDKAAGYGRRQGWAVLARRNIEGLGIQ
ncbi:MAG: hypothetical protein PHG35_01980 [Dehalococcoidales bacterium]|nr:hypothetical protein [Dehalococcoidales bacterium]